MNPTIRLFLLSLLAVQGYPVQLCLAQVLEEDELPADIDTLSSSEESCALVDSILNDAVSYLGVPYVEGGIDESGFDCSGLTYRVFADHGIILSRTVTGIESQGIAVNRDDLQPGDLMIFHNPSHVGIYLGDGEFIHCSSYLDRGVVITSIDHSNYLRRYSSARRIILDR
jgi:cell wall-associated NlpC family hydrolase